MACAAISWADMVVACIWIEGVMGGSQIADGNEIVGMVCGIEAMDGDWGDSPMIGDDCCARLSVVPSSRLWMPSPKVMLA